MVGRRDEESAWQEESEARDLWEDMVFTGRRYPGTPMAETGAQVAAVPPPSATSTRRYPMILDTDIGGDPDDIVALILAARHEPNLALVVTSDEYRGQRARLVRHLLDLLGRGDVAVVAGAGLGNTNHMCMDGLIPDSVLPQSDDVVFAVTKVVANTAGPVRWLSIGPMSNLASVLRANPEQAHQLRVTQMGGAINYRKPGQAEHNFRVDPAAAAFVVPLLLRPEFVLSDTTFRTEIEITEASPIFRRLQNTDEEWARLLVDSCRQFFTRFYPGTMMHDPLTLSVALELPFVNSGYGRVHVDNAGLFRVLEKAPLKPIPGANDAQSHTQSHNGTEAFYSVGAMYERFMAWLERALFTQYAVK